MTRATTFAGAIAVVLGLAALTFGYWTFVRDAPPALVASPSDADLAGVPPDALYGRITTEGGTTYEGRLRWGGGEEASWGDYFNGTKDGNPWVVHVPPERMPTESDPLVVFGVEIVSRERELDLGRPFMSRFGDIARIEADGTDVTVTLKSGTRFVLDRLEAGDFDDGVRVWDATRGVVDLASGVENTGPHHIRTIELLPVSRPAATSDRLHGTVHTREGGELTGFVQWDRQEGLGSDELDGRAEGGPTSVRFDTVRSIERRSSDSSLVTLEDGREIALSAHREVGEGNRGVYVDDPRYGRVLVSWDAFERIDFHPGGTSPGYDDFPTGGPLTGTVTTRTGRRLAGRLVFDLDESETTETLDAPSRGVDYTIPFGLIASIVPPGRSVPARVVLHSGEGLQLEASGDLGPQNGGMLVFEDGGEDAEYVPWEEVERIDFDRPEAMYPPLD